MEFFKVWAKSFVALSVLVIALLAGSALIDHMVVMGNLDKPSKIPAQTSRVQNLIQKNECWTDDAPKNVIPGHSVVTLPGKRAKVMSADVGFGIWLDGNPGTVHAFCK